MKSLLTLAALLATLAGAPSAARADDVYADPNDPGHVTRVHAGVSEIDLGALGVLTHASQDNMSTTQVSTTLSARYQYFLGSALSIGGEALLAYDRQSSDVSTTSYGGTLFASAHARLGLGAFLRPTVALGALFGSTTAQTGVVGVSLDESSTAFLMRFQLPFAYFASERIVLQAGPELDVQLGSVTPSGSSSSTSFTTIVGGFSVAVGYAF